jgi:Dna[CI] antecedent, DciA
MERVARVIKNNKFSREIFTDDDLARAVWPSAVGKAIARHTSRVTLVRNRLVVEVEDAIWQKQLHTLREQILGRLRKVTGSATIEDLEFRVAVRRRQPQRAESRESTVVDSLGASDEADRIQDPVLKKVYRLSRKKATA